MLLDRYSGTLLAGDTAVVILRVTMPNSNAHKRTRQPAAIACIEEAL